MTYQHEETTWHDGDALTAANSANRWEDALTSLANDLSDTADAVGQLQAAAALNTGKVLVGTTTDRLATTPRAGVIFLDTTLGYPVYGNGTDWKKFSDNSTVSGAGGSASPQNFLGEVVSGGTIGQINLTWTAVGSAAVSAGRGPYVLYETRSPSGVSGATALSGTSTTRTPSTPGTYNYWLTAVVGGVETAASNVATVTLPYVAPGTGGGGGSSGTPAALLNIGSTGGHWNLGVGYQSGHVDYPESDLLGTTTGGTTFPPYFQLNSGGDAVQFKIFANGATTSSGTHYPRSEMREKKSDGTTNAAWSSSSSSTHVMQYDCRVLHLPPNKPWVTVGQIHDASSDALSIKFKGAASATNNLDVVAAIYDTDNATKLATGYDVASNTWMTIKIELNNNSLKIYKDGILKITSSSMASKSGLYFKLGNYLQTADDWGGFESASEYGLVEIKNLTVTHSPAI